MASWDVAVVGAGVFGLSVAWACQARGLSVLVLEAQRVGDGASGGPVGALSPHVPERWNAKKAFQFDALSGAEEFWRGIQAVSGIDPGYGRVGRLQPILDAKARDLAEARSAGAREIWGGVANWSVLDPGSYSHWVSPEAAPFGLIHDTLSARLNPTQALAALAKAVAQRGGDIRENWRVTYVEAGAVAGQDRLLARHVVLASGVSSAALPLQELVRPVKGQAAVLAAEADAPSLYADGIYCVPHGAAGVAVGSTSENDQARLGTDGQLEDLIARARRLCPPLAKADVAQRWSGLRPRAQRPDPMVGPVPGLERVWVANGGFKIGLALGPKIGEAVADLIEGQDPGLPETFTVQHHLDRARRRDHPKSLLPPNGPPTHPDP